MVVLRVCGDRIVDANGVLGIVKYAAARLGSKYVVGREGWKSMVESKIMYGCGALVWYHFYWYIKMWVHDVNGRVFARSNKYTF